MSPPTLEEAARREIDNLVDLFNKKHFHAGFDFTQLPEDFKKSAEEFNAINNNQTPLYSVHLIKDKLIRRLRELDTKMNRFALEQAVTPLKQQKLPFTEPSDMKPIESSTKRSQDEIIAAYRATLDAAINKVSKQNKDTWPKTTSEVINELASNLKDTQKEVVLLKQQMESNKPKIFRIDMDAEDLHNLEKMLDDFDQIAQTKTNPEGSVEMPKAGWKADENGTRKCYDKEGLLHREDGPAEMRTNGCHLYYKNGLLHREGGLPAMVGARGTEKYAVNGHYHRLGGLPAITWSKGNFKNEWWVNGEIQKAQKKDGTQEWYMEGCSKRDTAVKHRIDGPAVLYPNGEQEFWLEGTKYPNYQSWTKALEQFNQEQRLEKELIDEDPVDEFLDEELPETLKVPQSHEKKEKKAMKEKPSFADVLKKNATDAGYRVAGTQLTAAVKTGILNVMRKQGADNNAIQGFAAFLDTEFGVAFISFAIGGGLRYVPHFSDDERVLRLSDELMTGGMATAGNAVIGEAMQHILPAISQVLQNLPAAEPEKASIRVIEEKENKLVEALSEEEEDEASVETEEVSAKTMKA